MANNRFVLNLLQIIFTLVGLSLIVAGYFSAPDSKTGDGFPLNTFLYGLGSFFILFPLLLFGIIRYVLRREEERTNNLINNGIKGKARVLAMRPTSVYVHNVQQVVMDLQVTTDAGERYETTYRKAVPMQYYNIIRPDLDLPVYIDPADRKKLYVDFQQAWANLAKQKPVS